MQNVRVDSSDKWTAASARRSIEYFEQAIQRAANYALAYAALANACQKMPTLLHQIGD
jgi:hypothetical protein